MNLSRKHGKHIWRRHKVVCASACRHRSAQPLEIKCILLLKKKKHSTHSCLFWLSLPHLLLSCFVIFLGGFDRTRRFCMFSYVCRVPRRDLCPPPPFFFFFFFEDAWSQNPRWRCSLTPRWVSTERSYRSCQTPPLVRQRGRDECYKSLTSEPHARTHNMPWFFSQDRGSKLQTLQSFYVILAVFTASQSPFYRSLKITSEAHILVQRRPSVLKFMFLTLSRGLLTNKRASQQRHFKIGFLIMVKISKAAGRGSGGKC